MMKPTRKKPSCAVPGGTHPFSSCLVSRHFHAGLLFVPSLTGLVVHLQPSSHAVSLAPVKQPLAGACMLILQWRGKVFVSTDFRGGRAGARREHAACAFRL